MSCYITINNSIYISEIYSIYPKHTATVIKNYLQSIIVYIIDSVLDYVKRQKQQKQCKFFKIVGITNCECISAVLKAKHGIIFERILTLILVPKTFAQYCIYCAFIYF